MKIGIVTQTRPEWVEEFIRSCKDLNLPHILIDMKKQSWFDESKKSDVLLWRVHQADPESLLDARNKIPLLETNGIVCFPNPLMLWLYDNKIRQTYFFMTNGIPAPVTFITSDKSEAHNFTETCIYPLVYKRSYGASSIGVSLVETPQVARSIINRELRAPTNKLRKAVKHCVRKLNLPYRQPDGYVYFQQYIESDSDLRIVTFGDSVVSVFRRLNRPHDFRASGSGLWEQITEPAFPVDACDLSIDISRRHGFPVMSYDFLFHKGRWLVSEISYTFLLNNIYVDTLFRRTQFGYQKLGPIQMGVNHICAIIGHDLS